MQVLSGNYSVDWDQTKKGIKGTHPDEDTALSSSFVEPCTPFVPYSCAWLGGDAGALLYDAGCSVVCPHLKSHPPVSLSIIDQRCSCSCSMQSLATRSGSSWRCCISRVPADRHLCACGLAVAGACAVRASFSRRDRPCGVQLSKKCQSRHSGLFFPTAVATSGSLAGGECWLLTGAGLLGSHCQAADQGLGSVEFQGFA